MRKMELVLFGVVDEQNQGRVVVVHIHVVFKLKPNRIGIGRVTETTHKLAQQHHVLEVTPFFESQFASTHGTRVVFQKPRLDTYTMKRVTAFEKHVVARFRFHLSNREPRFIQTNTTIHDRS
jgi:hypothetical protein